MLSSSPVAAARPDPVRPAVRAIGRALPENHYATDVLSQALWDEWGGTEAERARFDRIRRSAGVRGRHLALPLEEYRSLRSFGEANAAWVRAGTELGAKAMRDALGAAGLEARDVDHLLFTTVTGVSSPSLDVKIANRLGLRADLRRTPMFGLGCVGGAAGLARAADYLRGFPGHVAVLLSVELCSLTLQLGDRSLANVISTALFADGAAAVVLAGGERRGSSAGTAEIVASRSLFFHDTEEVMGWRVESSGFHVVLTAGIPDLVRARLRPAIEHFLAEHGLALGDIRHWIAHTGGPKVLRSIESALDLPADALARSWRSLATIGNLSSASVLHVAADLFASGEARPGDHGVMLALGPGFCAEVVLLEW